MGIAIGSNSINSITADLSAGKAKTAGLESVLKNSSGATDEELMDACKSFEAYLLEQVFKGMEKTVMKSEEENDYLAQFGDTLYEAVAKEATESQGLGIAQMLYESMKRNS